MLKRLVRQEKRRYSHGNTFYQISLKNEWHTDDCKRVKLFGKPHSLSRKMCREIMSDLPKRSNHRKRYVCIGEESLKSVTCGIIISRARPLTSVSPKLNLRTNSLNPRAKITQDRVGAIHHIKTKTAEPGVGAAPFFSTSQPNDLKMICKICWDKKHSCCSEAWAGRFRQNDCIWRTHKKRGRQRHCLLENCPYLQGLAKNTAAEIFMRIQVIEYQYWLAEQVLFLLREESVDKCWLQSKDSRIAGQGFLLTENWYWAKWVTRLGLTHMPFWTSIVSQVWFERSLIESWRWTVNLVAAGAVEQTRELTT